MRRGPQVRGAWAEPGSGRGEGLLPRMQGACGLTGPRQQPVGSARQLSPGLALLQFNPGCVQSQNARPWDGLQRCGKL